MLVHSVFFWLKPETTADQKAAFKKGLESLRGIEANVACYIGTPAPTDRPVIDRSYTFALTVIFKDMAGHDVYQEHALHKAFLNQFKTQWSKVLIYDAE
jgi:hypothetical protein